MADLFNIELGRAIRAAREARGMTQATLGSQVNLSRTSITNIECGRQRLLVDQLATIAQALDATVPDLMPSLQFLESSRERSTEASIEEMPTVKNWVESVKQLNRHRAA